MRAHCFGDGLGFFQTEIVIEASLVRVAAQKQDVAAVFVRDGGFSGSNIGIVPLSGLLGSIFGVGSVLAQPTINTQAITNDNHLQGSSAGSTTTSLSEQYSTEELIGTKDTIEEIEDEFTSIAINHLEKGIKSYDGKNYRRASIEFVNGLNILKRRKIPSKKEVVLLEWLIKLNEETNEPDKVTYYSAQLEKVKQKLIL